jgi:hypothetical protein
MEEDCKYHTIKPSNLKRENYKKRPFHGWHHTHNLKHHGEEMDLGKENTYIQESFS